LLPKYDNAPLQFPVSGGMPGLRIPHSDDLQEVILRIAYTMNLGITSLAGCNLGLEISICESE
jgi:hypothetical protein